MKENDHLCDCDCDDCHREFMSIDEKKECRCEICMNYLIGWAESLEDR